MNLGIYGVATITPQGDILKLLLGATGARIEKTIEPEIGEARENSYGI